MYFACKCNEYTQDQITILKNIGTLMEAHINVLWHLKQVIMYEKPRAILMRKLHSHNHISKHIRMFGPIALADTADFESVHKFFTSGLRRQTSKSLCSQAHEMLIASVVQSYTGHLDFFASLQVDGIDDCKKNMVPRLDK